MSAIMRATKARAPTTIPAIAPPDNPLFFPAGALVAVAPALVPVDVADVEVEVGTLVEKLIDAVIVGSTTLAHLSSAPAL